MIRWNTQARKNQQSGIAAGTVAWKPFGSVEIIYIGGGGSAGKQSFTTHAPLRVGHLPTPIKRKEKD